MNYSLYIIIHNSGDLMQINDGKYCIDQNFVQSNFMNHIQKNEPIHTMEENPPEKHFSPTKSSFFQKIYGYLVRCYIHYRIINPLLKQIVQNKKSPEEIKAQYISSSDLRDKIQDKIRITHHDSLSLFEPDEIDSLIQEEFMNAINKRLLALKAPLWDSTTREELEALRLVKILQNNSNENNQKIIDQLHRIFPLNLPLNEIKAIPITDRNREQLIFLWESVIGHCFVKGDLKNLSMLSYPENLTTKTHYAIHYLTELASAKPGNSDDKFGEPRISDLCQELEGIQSQQNLKLFIIQILTKISDEDEQFLTKIIKNPTLEHEIQVYKKFVYESISHIIAHNLPDNHLEQIKVLTSQTGEDFFNQIFHELNFNDEFCMQGVFDEKIIKDFFYNELEIKIKKNFNLLPSQIHALRQFRLNKDLNSKQTNESLNELLYNDEIISAVREEGPSGINAGRSANLMFVTKLLNKIFLKIELSELEKEKIYEIMQDIKTDKTLAKIIKKMFVKNNEIEDLIDLPPFLSGIINRLRPGKANEIDKKNKIDGVMKHALSFVNDYFKTIEYVIESESILNINKKLERLLEKYRNQRESILPEDRLTIAEIGVLGRFLYHFDRKNLGEFSGLDSYEKLGLIGVGKEAHQDSDDELIKLMPVYYKVKNNMEAFNTIILHAADEYYHDGDLLAIQADKQVKWNNKPLDLQNRMTSLVSNKLLHGAKIFHDDKKKLRLSEVIRNYSQDEMKLRDYLISDIWKIDITSMIDPTLHFQLQQIYGEGWKDIINEKYRKIEKALHSHLGKKNKNINNNFTRLLNAGLAHYTGIAHFLGRETEGRYDSKPIEFEEIHNDFFHGIEKSSGIFLGNSYIVQTNTVQFCSEFASRATLAAMLQLNKQLSKEINEHRLIFSEPSSIIALLESKNIPISDKMREYFLSKNNLKGNELIKKDIKTLKSAGYSKNEINLIVRVKNQEIFDLPYKRNERFETMHPGRMVEILLKKGCLIQQEPPKEVSDLVDFRK